MEEQSKLEKNATPIRDKHGRFLKGTPPNNPHGGRPLGSVSLVTMLREHLQACPEDATAIVQALIRMGKGRELYAIKEIMDRVDGKVADTHKIESDAPVYLVFKPAKELLSIE